MVQSGLSYGWGVDSVHVGLLLRGRLLWVLILCMCWRSSGRDWLLEGLVPVKIEDQIRHFLRLAEDAGASASEREVAAARTEKLMGS